MTTADELLGRLTGLGRDELAKVLAHRPDVLQEPWPRRLDVVAARLAAPESVDEALLGLPLPHAQVLRALQLCYATGPRPAPVAGIARLLGAEPGAIESFVDELADRALVWREGDGVVLLELLRRSSFQAEGLGPPIADLLEEVGGTRHKQLSRALGLPLGRPEIVRFFRDGDRVRELFATAPEPTQKLLRDMADGVPEVNGMAPFDASGSWAFEHGFLFGTFYGSTAMPLEVGLALRGPDHRLPFTPDEPECPVTHIGVESAEAMSSAAALRLLDRVSAILELAAAEPLPLLKDGTIGARLIKKIAKETKGTPAEIEVAIDLAAQAGLLLADEPPAPRRGQKAPPPTLAPNPDLARPAPALLYRLLLTTWWDPAPPEFETDVAALVRRLVVRLLARLEPGAAIADVAALTPLAGWHAPMLPAEDFAGHVQDALTEGELLGLIAHGAVTFAGRALLEPDGLVEVTDELISRARTTALFGTDLTAIVTGPPSTELAMLLDRVADRETQGSASTWRFSPASVRRALDNGATPEGLLDELGAVARGGLPQPLSYLIKDVSRRHGEVGVIDVRSVIVGDNPGLLAEIAAHRKLLKLGVALVAPSVLTSSADAVTTLAALRDAGYAPVRRASDGAVVVRDEKPLVAAAEPIAIAARPDVVEDPLEHAARLLREPEPASRPLKRGALMNLMPGDRSAKWMRLIWQLETGFPVWVTYEEENGEKRKLLVSSPELHGETLDVWCDEPGGYRRLELSRISPGGE
jgi:hypothetical protein